MPDWMRMHISCSLDKHRNSAVEFYLLYSVTACLSYESRQALLLALHWQQIHGTFVLG